MFEAWPVADDLRQRHFDGTDKSPGDTSSEWIASKEHRGFYHLIATQRSGQSCRSMAEAGFTGKRPLYRSSSLELFRFQILSLLIVVTHLLLAPHLAELLAP